MSQTSQLNFKVLEDDGKFDIENLMKLFDYSYPAYIVRNYLDYNSCNEIANEFRNIISETSGGNRQDFVPVNQIGATQFTKSTLEYFNQCEQTLTNIKRLVNAISDTATRDDFMIEQTLHTAFRERGCEFGPSSFNGKIVNLFTARKWINSDTHGLSLLPHEDLSQLNLAKPDGYEIGNIDRVIACNLCIANSKGGELLVWNIDPDKDVKISLGVQDSGYPYPLKMLENIEFLTMNINPGDLYFINANHIHAVKEIHGSERITLGRFLGFCSNRKIVYWT